MLPAARAACLTLRLDWRPTFSLHRNSISTSPAV